jgi:hypothetical protein
MLAHVSAVEVCPVCGRALREHDRDYRFRLPEPVLALAESEPTPGIWMSEPDPNQAEMMQAPELGEFVRCLLPVHLTGGHSIRFGVRSGCTRMTSRRAYEGWWAPSYTEFGARGSTREPPTAVGLVRRACSCRSDGRDRDTVRRS